MNWTAERPIEPGYYWFQNINCEPLVAKVRPNVFNPSAVLDVVLPGDKVAHEVGDFPFARWSGPIAPPALKD